MATNSKGYDPNKDYSAAIEAAKKSGASQAVINQLQQERQNKINDKYGGKEPTMYGSNQTYSQASAGGNTGAINNAVGLYNQYTGATAKTDPYAGTNYHQNAIDAAIAGDWDAVTNYLGQREEKVAAQGGDNRGKTSAEIYAELWNQYGAEIPVASGGTGFTYDESSKPTYDDVYNAGSSTGGIDLSNRIEEMLNQVLNRDEFSYSTANDPLYQQYASMYEREGNRAMNDTLAAAAATAGGMNSYAMTAANQANNYYMSQLGDKIPELYQLAYEMYLQDIDNQVRDLGLLQDMDDTQYNRYRDTLSDWYNDRDFAYNKYRDDVGDYWKQKNYDNSNSHWQSEFDHMVSQDALAQANRNQEWAWETGQTTGNTAYNKAMEILNSGAMPTADMLKQAGMTEQQASAILAAVKAEQAAALGNYTGTTGSTGSTGSTGGGYTGKDKAGDGYDYTNGGMTKSEIEDIQRKIGANVDGLWGPETQKKWEEYQKNGGGDPYSDTRNLSSYDGQPASQVLSSGALAKLNTLKTMRGSIGSKEGIANSITTYVTLEEITEKEARYMYEFFGYDPDEYLY